MFVKALWGHQNFGQSGKCGKKQSLGKGEVPPRLHTSMITSVELNGSTILGGQGHHLQEERLARSGIR